MDYRKSNREPARKNALGEEPMRDVATSEARDANEAHDAASDSLGSAPTKKTDCKWPERSDIVEPCDVWFKGDDRAIVTCSPNSPHPRVYLMKHETIWTVDDLVEDADLEQLLEGYELAPNETEDPEVCDHEGALRVPCIRLARQLRCRCGFVFLDSVG